MASGDRERELQRQLTQAGLQAEALLEGSQAAAAAESEQLVQGLIQQRDTANEALLVGLCPVHACPPLIDWMSGFDGGQHHCGLW